MNSLRAVVRYLAAVQSLVADSVRLAWQDLTASKFSLASNLLPVFVGLCFYAALVSISVGVGQFMESYYTRTMSLTTLLVYYSPDVPGAAPFTADYRERLAAQ